MHRYRYNKKTMCIVCYFRFDFAFDDLFSAAIFISNFHLFIALVLA